MNHLPHTLEGPPRPEDQGSERRWAWASLVLLGLVFLALGGAVWQVAGRTAALPQGAADHGPLPAGIRAEVLGLVAPHLDQVEFLELPEKGQREFRLKGRPRALLSMDFHRAFRPLVAQRLRPLLTPYGEVLSFDITSLDLPPVRLRDFEKGTP
jgi:hypothetical protein